MNWDNATAAVARALDERDTTWHLGGPIKKFVEGAKWQRADLRTDEAVERVAESMFVRSQAAYEYQDRTDWDELHKSNQDVYRSRARDVITALLGEEP